MKSNNLIGINVRHKKWGKGVIKHCDDDVVVVHFPNTLDGEKDIKLAFPGAFQQGFLSVEDALDILKVEKNIEECGCTFCGKNNVPTEKISDFRVCKKCKNEKFDKCDICGEYAFNHTFDWIYSYQRTRYNIEKKACPTCQETKTFICGDCGYRLANSEKTDMLYNGKSICVNCFKNYVKACHSCNHHFYIDNNSRFYDYDSHKNVYICSDCKGTQTFICDYCNAERLIGSKVNSKYVPTNKNMCKECACTCSVCGERMPSTNMEIFLNKCYCTDCWNQRKEECPICGDEYIPQANKPLLCPDCISMQDYETRISAMDFTNYSFKEMSYYQLDYYDRCALFTTLYENCSRFHSTHKNDEYNYKFLAINLLGYRVIVTYLSNEIVKDARCSLDVTMTEFRTRKGLFSVYAKIEAWLPTSNKTLKTSDGDYTILNYPIKLRVQTSYDKVYGKEWNGPNDYFEIGNYGDTTDFRIVAVKRLGD